MHTRTHIYIYIYRYRDVYIYEMYIEACPHRRTHVKPLVPNLDKIQPS